MSPNKLNFVEKHWRKPLEQRKAEDTGEWTSDLSSFYPCCSSDVRFTSSLGFIPTTWETELRPCHLICMWYRAINDHKLYDNLTWFGIWKVDPGMKPGDYLMRRQV